MLLQTSLKLIILEAHIKEGLSDPFYASLDVISPKVQDFLGQEITLIFEDRSFLGMIFQVQETGIHHESFSYRLIVRPSFYKLHYISSYRIFQNQTTLDILATLFPYFESRIQNNKKHDYLVQYGETDLHFFSRLLEQEGLFYIFEKDKLVLHDRSEGLTSLGNYPLSKAGNPLPEKDVIKTLFQEKAFMPTSCNSADYNEMTPSVHLKTGEGPIQHYPGGFKTLLDGEELLKRRLQAYEWQTSMIHGTSTVTRFAPGFIFHNTGHFQKKLNQDYLLYKVTHHFKKDAYENDYTAIPTITPFRPLVVTPKPKIHGHHTAVVIGPSGDDVFCDDLGRIHIQFPWENKPSCWVRVAQNLAGNGFGGLVIPRVGMEVVVTFLDGDPDRPLVIGCVYHATNLPPDYVKKEPLKSTFRTSSHNEIAFDDKKDHEEIYLYAKRDFREIIEKNYMRKIHKGNYTFLIEQGDQSTTLQSGNWTISLEKGDCTANLAHGNLNLLMTKGDCQTILETGDMKISVNAGNIHIECKGNITLSSEGSLKLKTTESLDLLADQNIRIEAGQNMTLKTGLNFNVHAGVNTLIEAGANATHKAGAVAVHEGATALMKGATVITA